jgi:hypothetical protein
MPSPQEHVASFASGFLLRARDADPGIREPATFSPVFDPVRSTISIPDRELGRAAKAEPVMVQVLVESEGG